MFCFSVKINSKTTTFVRWEGRGGGGGGGGGGRGGWRLIDENLLYSMWPSSRPSPILGNFVFNAFFRATNELKEKGILFKR